VHDASTHLHPQENFALETAARHTLHEKTVTVSETANAHHAAAMRTV